MYHCRISGIDALRTAFRGLRVSGITRCSLLATVVLFGNEFFGDRATAQSTSPQSNVANRPNDVRQPRPEFLVRAEVNNSTRIYREGDTFSVRVVSEVDAFIYVIYQQADGSSLLVFPNAQQRDNRLNARQAVQIPAEDDFFRWKIAAPFGNELVKVIASKRPIEALSTKSLTEKRFNPIDPKLFKGIGQELGAETAAEWSEVETPIETVPRDQSEDKLGQRRIGIFFGVAEHMFNSAIEASRGTGLNLPCPHRDARQLEAMLREVGQLSESRTFTNEEATRENFRKMVEEWLPGVSRPGDTVFIYYSGHGTTMSANSRTTHILVPHDFFTLSAAIGLMKQREAGTLKPNHESYLKVAAQLVQQHGAEKANEILTTKTGISDQEFGHWLQKLDGRQVIVILDVCFAGGFGPRSKSLNPDVKNLADLKGPLLQTDGEPGDFRFMQEQFVRLKNIGQPETALLASSRADQTSQVRKEKDLSVMTFELISGLKEARNPFTLPQAYDVTAARMQRYFSNRQQSGHQPLLFNYCSRPVLLRP